MTREIEVVALDVVRLGNLAIGTDQITDPPRNAMLGVLLAFLTNRVVGGPHRLVRIGQERIGKFLVIGEFLLLRHGVKRSAENDAIGAC